MPNSEVLKIVRKYIQVLLQEDFKIDKVIVFGSVARAEAKPESDIDVLVISSIFDVDPNARVGELWRLTKKVDSRIEPIPVGLKRFNEDDISTIIEVARREGIEVAA